MIRNKIMIKTIYLIHIVFLLALTNTVSTGVPATFLKPLILKPNTNYFEIDGHQAFLYGRNPTGWQVSQFVPLFAWQNESGGKIARIHITVGMPPMGQPGIVDETWAKSWDKVFQLAASKSIHVIPVFDSWARWNDGSPGNPPREWLQWFKSPYNHDLGGPAISPVELLKDSVCRKLWLAWAGQLVKRWQTMPNICAWELFSELDLVTGANEDNALDFVREAASVVRKSDPLKRPITTSLSGVGKWPKLFSSNALDIIQIHSYANDPRYNGNLDEMILKYVRERLTTYSKPVLIGESGLDSALTTKGTAKVLLGSPQAKRGLQQAIWAAIVSGAMAGRMLWWEDGYDQYSSVDLRTSYQHAESAAVKFVAGTDFTGFKPVDAKMSEELIGGAIGNATTLVGWFRDSACRAPDWTVRKVAGQTVQIKLPGKSGKWRAEFYNTRDAKVLEIRTIQSATGMLSISLPTFDGDIAFKLILIKIKI